MPPEPVLLVHGGAGAFARSAGAEERRRELCRVLEAVLAEPLGALRRGAPALDAVVSAVARMEDEPLLNAGRGSVLTGDGRVEMDAAVMEGTGCRAGAVACVRRLAHPVEAARAVLERSPHVLLVGEGAEAFAVGQGLARCEPEELVTEERRRALARARASGRLELDHGGASGGGTVGAVARDAEGRLAAATSTGGVTGQHPGRVGDSPLPGAGTWADDRTCAVSGTGDGECFVRAAFAHEVDARLRLAAAALEDACASALERVSALGGAGGCIAIDRRGRTAMPFTSGGMARAWPGPDGLPRSAVGHSPGNR